jgi:hypothetical protein
MHIVFHSESIRGQHRELDPPVFNPRKISNEKLVINWLFNLCVLLTQTPSLIWKSNYRFYSLDGEANWPSWWRHCHKAKGSATSRDISLYGDIFVSLKTKNGGNFQTMVLGIFRGENYV